MSFRIAEHSDLHIVFLRGELTAEGWGKLRTAVIGALENGVMRFVLNFQDLQSLDSLGVGVLVGLHHQIETKSGSLIFTRVSDRVRSVLSLCRLDEVLNLVDEALGDNGPVDDLADEMRETLEKVETDELRDRFSHMIDELDGRLMRIEKANRVLQDLVAHGDLETETSESRYRAIFEKAGDAVLVVEEQTGEIIEVNQSAREMIKLGDADLSKLSLGKLFPELQGLSHSSLADAIKNQANETAQASLRLRPLVGESLPVHVAASGAHHQGQALIMLHIRDFSAVQAVEENLRDQVFRLISLNAIEQRLASCNDPYEMLGELLRQVQALLDLPNGLMVKIKQDTGRVNRIWTIEENPDCTGVAHLVSSEADVACDCIDHLIGTSEITNLDPQALGPLVSAGLLPKSWPRLQRRWVSVAILREKKISALMVLGASMETGWEDSDLTLVQNVVNLVGVNLAKSYHFQEVQKAHRQHRKLFENSRDAIGVVNLDTGLTVSANQQWERLTGQRIREGADTLLLNVIDETDWSEFHNQMSLLREAGEGRWESRLACGPAGDETWIQIRASVVDSEPEPLALLILINITEKRRHEREIQRLSHITRSNPNLVLQVSASGEILWANPGVNDLLMRAGINPRQSESALPSDLHTWIKQFRERGARTARFEHSLRERTVLYTVSSSVDDDTLIFHGVEITALKHLEHAIAASEENYRVLVEGAREGICSIRDGRFHTANQRLCDIIGATPDSIIGASLRNCVVEEDWAELCAVLHEVTHLRERRDGVTFRLCVPDAETRDIEATIVPAEVVGEDHLLGYFTDVTERHRLETELQQMQRIESIGQLSRGIAKDFNSILTGIIGNVSLLMSRLDPNGDTHRLARIISDAAERGSDLTRELLMFARGGRFSPEVFDLNRIVADNVDYLRRMLGASVEIQFTPHATACPVEYDRNLVRQSLYSLCLNASEAMPTGGQIRISVTPVQISEAEARRHPEAKPGPHICIEITDTGSGIPADKLSWVMEPFFSTKGSGECQGLGLPMVVSAIKPVGGFLAIASEEGKGTTVRVYLPQTDKPVPHVREAIESDLQPDGIVLVVDDEDLVRDLTSEILADAGFKVLTAIDGADGLKQFEMHQDEITAVVLDIVMPVMDGPETFRQLRQRNSVLPILLASGYASPEETQELLATGRADFLSKPFRREALLRKLDDLIDSRSN